MRCCVSVFAIGVVVVFRGVWIEGNESVFVHQHSIVIVGSPELARVAEEVFGGRRRGGRPFERQSDPRIFGGFFAVDERHHKVARHD